jgi:site-specific recombinase XerD
MLDMTLEQGHQVFLKALAGNNFSTESIRAYNADITQFVDFLKSVRVDWNNPQKITRIDIVEFMHRLAGLRRTGTTRARKLASIRHFLKFLKENEIIAGNPAETVIRARKEEKDPTVLFKNEYKALLFEAQGNSRDYAILMTFLKSGIRESELAALHIDDVDLFHDGVPGVISRKFSVREIATKSLLVARNDYICKNNTFCYTLLHTPREM